MTNISSIASAIQSGIEEAVAIVNEAIQQAQAEVSHLLDPTTTTSPLSSEPPSTTTTSTTTVTTPKPTSITTATTSATTTNAQTTTTPPLASFKCAIYENMYIQTWHHTSEASPPIKNCAGSSGNFEIVKNKFVKYTLRTSGSRIDELTLILFDEASTKAICTVSGIDQDFGWMDCEENGINPSLIKTATHETLTVYYAKGNFTTIVTRDIGFNVGRFVINVYQSPELAIPSTVQGQASIYECRVVTGPHISTWRLKGTGLELNQQQGCYMPSMVTLVKNEYIYYRVKVSGSWMVESEIWLYDVTTKKHVCVLYSEDLEMKADDGDKCREHVQGPQGPIYECSAITDPHVYTWRLKGSAQGPNQYQDCYMPSMVTISNLLAACVKDLMDTGEPKVAESIVNVVMIEDLTSDMTSISSIASAIQSGIEEAVAIVNEAIEEAQAEVSQILGITAITSPLSSELPSTTTTTTIDVQSTTTPPLASFKCAIYENMYIQTWHDTNQASPPIKNCAGSSGNFEIVKNKFVKYTLRTSGSSIDELTLILFDEASTKAVCTVTAIDEDFGWMDCEENGIIPSLVKTSTHETLTVYYAKGNFTTIVTRDIGFNVGRFVINVYQSPELAIHSNGICNLLSSCSANGRI
ncbi:unnamed protein product [Adineta steineri]|uniref:Uncharacterized protein n=1 Tax=Adineta steineri TaxID=433720 RepID=A0A819H2Y3_9BILA|nr:unnamed protein product [Adineta steineri]